MNRFTKKEIYSTALSFFLNLLQNKIVRNFFEASFFNQSGKKSSEAGGLLSVDL